MKLLKLIFNEIQKIIKVKIIYIFLIVAIISLVVIALIIQNIHKSQIGQISEELSIVDDTTLEYNISNMKYKIKSDNDLSEKEKELLNKKIEVYQYIIDNDSNKIIDAEFKKEALDKLIELYEQLYSIDDKIYINQYNTISKNIDKLFSILKDGTFEDYISFNKTLYMQDYKSGKISKNEYESLVKSESEKLKYEIGKYTSSDSAWKRKLLDEISNMESQIKNRVSLNSHKKYIDDKDAEKIGENIMVLNYMLENNIQPYFMEDYKLPSYCKYRYSEIANMVTIIIIGAFIIMVSSSSISDEYSKGTIKFLLITPAKRSEILLSKIISIILILILLVIIISQIGVIISNVVFGSNLYSYIYVKDGLISFISNYWYETLRYLLRLPELLFYLALGLTLSSTTKNTAISTGITVAGFLGINRIINAANDYMPLEFLNYLPFSNFDFINKVFALPMEAQEVGIGVNLTCGIIIISVSIILLLFTTFESFNKKQI